MNIFICGVPRAGKTTLAKKMKEILGNANLLVSEALRNGFQAMDKENYVAWGTKSSKQRQEDFPIFLKEFLAWNEKFSAVDNIVDLAIMDIQNIVKIADEKDKVVCLGFGGKSVEEIFDIIRSYEKDGDYTTDFSDEKLLAFWGNIVKRDLDNIQFCKEDGVLYIDNSLREEGLAENVIKLLGL